MLKLSKFFNEKWSKNYIEIEMTSILHELNFTREFYDVPFGNFYLI